MVGVTDVQINKCNKGSLCNDNHLHRESIGEGTLSSERVKESSERERVCVCVMFKLDLKVNKAERGFPPTRNRANEDRLRVTASNKE